MAQNKNQSDILIIGGGLAGLTAAALFGARGFSVVCLDSMGTQRPASQSFHVPERQKDGRTTAISYGSSKVLRAAGVWHKLEAQACAIYDIDILDGPSSVLLSFGVKETNAPAFGWIIDNELLRDVLTKHIAAQKNISHITGVTVTHFDTSGNMAIATDDTGKTYKAKLLIGADGQNSSVRKHLNIPVRAWPYKQTALVCVVGHEHSHQNLAVEHFRNEGPFAILPMVDDADGQHRSSVVWTEHGREAAEFLQADLETFEAALQARFPARYGEVKLLSERFSYPLGLKHAYSYIGPRVALVAEAAHKIHPIAGQGLNMGLRDIAVLAGLIEGAADIGAPDVLQNYQRARRPDNVAMAAATDTLNKLFSNKLASIGVMRRVGVRAVAHLPFAKRFFMNQAMGASSNLPDFIEHAA